tara:strand:- start:27 stop:341 length:315 start_codon:yes stop_codon:yes gene_type:complete
MSSFAGTQVIRYFFDVANSQLNIFEASDFNVGVFEKFQETTEEHLYDESFTREMLHAQIALLITKFPYQTVNDVLQLLLKEIDEDMHTRTYDEFMTHVENLTND